MFHIFGD